MDLRQRPVAVIEFTSVSSAFLVEVALAHAVDEGEGNATLETCSAELGKPRFLAGQPSHYLACVSTFSGSPQVTNRSAWIPKADAYNQQV
jgi:hypothetical protein